MIRYFEPPPPPSQLPAELPSPFAVPPHPLALRAIAELEVGPLREGKMFGVLVVRDGERRIGYLRAFSGMLDGRWDHDGYVGPVFAAAARAAFWPAGEAELGVLAAGQRIVDDDPAHADHAALAARHAGELAALKTRHAARKAERAIARQGARGGGAQALDQQSRADSAERRELDRAHAAELAPVAARVAVLRLRSL
ncbi:MAG: RluA family pseudouridine synthase, partial [Kofleriaceae bacterium]